MQKDYSDLTEEEQIALISQTDNSLKEEDKKIEQPPQDPNYQPDPDEIVEQI